MLKFIRPNKSPFWLLLATIAIGPVTGCGRRPSPPPELSSPSSGKTSVPPPATARPYKVFGKWYHPLQNATGFSQNGLASWYGPNFHGRPTANGEIFDMNQISAAHKTLPIGTWVKVYNLRNGRELALRINDRGPFVKGRIIDLSKAAAKELGVYGHGTDPVLVTALGKAADAEDTVSPQEETPPQQASAVEVPETFTPVDYYKGNFTFQIGAYRSRANAERYRDQLAQRYQNAHVSPYFDGSRTLYRVRVGQCQDLATAEQYAETLMRQGFNDVFVVAQ